MLRRYHIILAVFMVTGSLFSMAVDDDKIQPVKKVEFLDAYSVGLVRFENRMGDTNYDYLSISAPLILKEELKKTGDIFIDRQDLLKKKAKIPNDPSPELITLQSNFRLIGSLSVSNTRIKQAAVTNSGSSAVSNVSLRKSLSFSANVLEKNEMTFQETAVKHNCHFLFYGWYGKSGTDKIVLNLYLYSAIRGKTVHRWKRVFNKNRVLIDLPAVVNDIRRKMIGMETVPLRIETVPDKVMVYLDGTYAGLTPLDIPAVAATNHTVLFRKEKYQRLQVQFSLTNSSQKYTLRRKLTPLPERGTVMVKSIPSGADVYIDLIKRGKTPLFLSNYPAGSYRVTLVKDGFQMRRSQLIIKDGQTTRVLLDMPKTDPNALPLDKKKERYRVAMNVSLYTSAASLLVYAYGNFQYHSHYDVYQQKIALQDYSGAQQEADKVNSYRNVMNIGFWGTIGALSTSTYFLIRYLLIDDKELGMIDPAFSVGTTANSLFVNWRF